MTVSASASLSRRGGAAIPRAPVRAAIARMIFSRAAALVPVRVSYPDGRMPAGGPAASPEFQLVRPAAFFARLGRDAKIGFGEAYMAGDWRPAPGTDLADLLTPCAERLTALVPAPRPPRRASAPATSA